MIDWLETLWKAAEEGAEVSLPGEPDLRPVKAGIRSRTEERGSADRKEEPEGELAPWQNLRFGPAQPERSVRSAVWSGENPVGSAAIGRLYRSAAESPLAALYHRVRETVSPGQSGMSGHGGTVVVREEVSAAPGLTEERLDRSLRRDSRRYDGGMSIY